MVAEKIDSFGFGIKLDGGGPVIANFFHFHGLIVRDHFADVVTKKIEPKVNGIDGLISLKIFAAITKSAKIGKKIRI